MILSFLTIFRENLTPDIPVLLVNYTPPFYELVCSLSSLIIRTKFLEPWIYANKLGEHSCLIFVKITKHRLSARLHLQRNNF